MVLKGFEAWQTVLGPKLEQAMAQHPPRLPVTARQLWTTCSGAFEGGLILSKLYGKPEALARHLAQHRNYVELLFAR